MAHSRSCQQIHYGKRENETSLKTCLKTISFDGKSELKPGGVKVSIMPESVVQKHLFHSLEY